MFILWHTSVMLHSNFKPLTLAHVASWAKKWRPAEDGWAGASAENDGSHSLRSTNIPSGND